MMGIVNRRIVDFFNVNVTDHICPRLKHRTIGDHVAEPAREMRREIGMLKRENARAFSGQIMIYELNDLWFPLPPGVGYGLKNIFFSDHECFRSLSASLYKQISPLFHYLFAILCAHAAHFGKLIFAREGSAGIDNLARADHVARRSLLRSKRRVQIACGDADNFRLSLGVPA